MKYFNAYCSAKPSKSSVYVMLPAHLISEPQFKSLIVTFGYWLPYWTAQPYNDLAPMTSLTSFLPQSPFLVPLPSFCLPR